MKSTRARTFVVYQRVSHRSGQGSLGMLIAPIVGTGGIRTVDDCREYFWAGADAVSLGSATWLSSYPGYALAPLRGLAVRRLLRSVAGHDPRPVTSGVSHDRVGDAMIGTPRQ